MCTQGGLAPGAQQWQTYVRSASSPYYKHLLGYLSAGSDAEPPAVNVSLAACQARCTASAVCKGLSFEADVPVPRGPIAKCYLKAAIHFVAYDASNAHCAFDGSRDDCPYNFYRTSGDINARWTSMLANLATTLRYRESPPLSRPGAWACTAGRLEHALRRMLHHLPPAGATACRPPAYPDVQ